MKILSLEKRRDDLPRTSCRRTEISLSFWLPHLDPACEKAVRCFSQEYEINQRIKQALLKKPQQNQARDQSLINPPLRLIISRIFASASALVRPSVRIISSLEFFLRYSKSIIPLPMKLKTLSHMLRKKCDLVKGIFKVFTRIPQLRWCCATLWRVRAG